MNLGQAKRKVLKLLDEKTSLAITADPASKFHDYFDMGQNEISINVPIRKVYTINKTQEGMAEFPMPDDFMDLITIHNKNNGRWINKTLYLSADDVGEFLIEYKAYPATIDDATPENYELEIDREAQEALCLYVAAQCEVKEYNLNYYDNFMSQYNNKIANIVNNKPIMATVVQLGGGKCSFL